MRRGLLVGLSAAALAALLGYFYFFGDAMNDQETASNLPLDPAGRRVALRTALANVGVHDPQASILIGQAILETGNFSSAEFPLCLSPWNRHVGSGKNGDWNGKVCMIGPDGRWTVYESDAAALKIDPTNAREHLRCFDSLEQACRDMLGLLGLSLYAHAKAALDAGDALGYAEAIADGDGKNGFVGPVGTTKAANYTAGLSSQYRALGVV